MPGSFRIGDWTVDPSACLLLHGQRRLKLSPRAMDVLVYLNDRAGEVVSADELLATLWPYTVKSSNAVAKVMTELRRALDEAEPGKRILETVPKRGYRLIAPVDALEEPMAEPHSANGAVPVNADAAQAIPAPADVPVVRTLVARRLMARWLLAAGGVGLLVVFLAIGGRESNAHRLTINDRAVELTARTDNPADQRSLDRVLTQAIAHFRNSGANDGRSGEEPDYRLELTLDSASEAVRASLSIQPAAPGGMAHHEEFEAPIADRLALVDSVLSHTIGDLSVLLDSAKVAQMREWGTANIDAYRLAAEGDSFMVPFSENSHLQAAERYKAAIAKDPNFGNAYGSLAQVYSNLAYDETDPEQAEQYRTSMRGVRREMLRASVDPADLEVVSRIIAFDSFSNVFDAARYVQGLLKRDPDSIYELGTYAELLFGAKLYDESRAYFARAIELRNAKGMGDRFERFFPSFPLVRGDHEEYVRQTKLLYENESPRKEVLRGLVLSHGQLGRHQEAEVYLARLSSLDPLWGFTARTMLMAVRGEITRDSEDLEAFQSTPGPLNQPKGEVCFMLGDVDCGVHYWSRIEPIWLRMLWVYGPSVEATFAPNVVADPRYQALLDSLGIGRSWRAYMRELAQELAPVTGIAVTSAPPPEDVAPAGTGKDGERHSHAQAIAPPARVGAVSNRDSPDS